MNSIYLIRHGEIVQSSPRRFVGQRDIPLTARGQIQMTALAEHLRSKDIGALYCSPLSRCVASATIIGQALSLEPVLEPGLREISLGAWEGLTKEEIQQEFPGEYEARGQDLANFCPQGGESFTQVLDRVWPIWLNITQTNSCNLAIVAHSGVNRVLLCQILGMPLENLLRFELDYGSIITLGKKEDGFVVQSIVNLLSGC